MFLSRKKLFQKGFELFKKAVGAEMKKAFAPVYLELPFFAAMAAADRPLTFSCF